MAQRRTRPRTKAGAEAFQDVRSLGSVLASGSETLRATGCAAPEQDAEAILAAALGVEPGCLAGRSRDVLPEGTVGVARERFERRAAREPLEYILGHCSFRGLVLRVDRRVLVPQATSGPLVELAHRLEPGGRVHDVGTGCGALALAIKHECPELAVTGSDISPDAIDVARANAQRLHLDVSFSVASGLPAGSFDLVVANLPSRDVAGRTTDYPAPELADHQPRVAVFAGAHDLALIRELLSRAAADQLLAVEHTPGQAARVRSLFRDPKTHQDLNGHDRVTVGHPAARP